MNELKKMDDFKQLMKESENRLSCDESDELILKYRSETIIENSFLRFIRTNYKNMNESQRLLIVEMLCCAMYEPSQDKLFKDIVDLVKEDENFSIRSFDADLEYTFFENMEEYKDDDR